MSAKWQEQFSAFHRVSKTPQCLRSVVRVRDVSFGAGDLVVMAGPCSVESEQQLMRTAEMVAAAGHMFCGVAHLSLDLPPIRSRD